MNLTETPAYIGTALMTTRAKLVLIALAAGLLVATTLGIGQAVAHHAFAAEFDGKAPVMLRGKVTKVEWINPHAWVHLSAVGTNGKAQAWMVEGGTPNTLLRGWDRSELAKARDRNCCARIPVQGPRLYANLQGQWPRRDLPRWAQTIPRVFWNRSAQGWGRSHRQVR